MPRGTASDRLSRRVFPGSAGADRARLATDIRVVSTELYFLPVTTRVPLKFGSETMTSVTCARARVTVQDQRGRTAVGWGETPLNVEWVWPSDAPYEERRQATLDFCTRLATRWATFPPIGHPLEIGDAFQKTALIEEIKAVNHQAADHQKLPLLAGLLCCSPFDIATYDAFGNLHGVGAFQALNRDFLSRDLSHFLESDDGGIDFRGRFPADYLRPQRLDSLLAWHLVGGVDPLSESEITGPALDDGHPMVLGDWIERDGLQCLKIKLRGVDYDWDLERLRRVGRVAEQRGVPHLTADFNCTVNDPRYVLDILDELASVAPRVYDSLLYIEQPFPYDLEKHQIDVREISARKPLFMDESAHNWQLVRLGRSLGWNGVALKTCKTLTGAILSLCWAKAHGMSLMVQDLTNPMLAQIPHVTLAAYADTIMGVETNAMQFYPEASTHEAAVHPGLYRRREGRVSLSTLGGHGFGYRVDEIGRPLPEPAIAVTAPVDESSDAVPPPHIELPNAPPQ